MAEENFCPLCGGDGWVTENEMRAHRLAIPDGMFVDGHTEVCPLCDGVQVIVTEARSPWGWWPAIFFSLGIWAVLLFVFWLGLEARR